MLPEGISSLRSAKVRSKRSASDSTALPQAADLAVGRELQEGSPDGGFGREGNGDQPLRGVTPKPYRSRRTSDPMMDRDVLSSLGLLLDIAEVALLFFFGITSRATLDGVFTCGRGGGKDYKRARTLSSLGLLLLIGGFALQIASNHLPAALRHP